MDTYENRQAFLKQTLSRLHDGPAALSPLETAPTPVPLPRKVLVVGHAAAADWNFQQANPTGTPVDFILLADPRRLPARSSAELAQYDFQVLQLPLRAVFADSCLWDGAERTEPQMEATFRHSAALLASLLEQYLGYHAQAGLTAFVANFMVPAVNPLGRLMPRHDLRNPQHFVARLNEELEKLVRSRDGVHLLDVDALTAFHGKKHFQDDLLHHFSHNGCWPGHLKDESRIEPVPPLHEHFTVAAELFRNALWMEIVGAWRAARPVQPVELVVVGLDGVLWPGTPGEAALETMDASVTEGWPAGLLEALSYFQGRGGRLAICTRNDRRGVEAAWARLYGSRFPLERFAALRCGPGPKSAMLREILEETGVDAGAALFINADPAQRTEAKAALPALRVLHGYHYYWRKVVLLAPEMQAPRRAAPRRRKLALRMLPQPAPADAAA